MSTLTRYRQSCPKCGKSFLTCGGTPLPAHEQVIIDLLNRTQNKDALIAAMLRFVRDELRTILSTETARESLASTGASAEKIEAEWIETLPWQAREMALTLTEEEHKP